VSNKKSLVSIAVYAPFVYMCAEQTLVVRLLVVRVRTCSEPGRGGGHAHVIDVNDAMQQLIGGIVGSEQQCGWCLEIECRLHIIWEENNGEGACSAILPN
jgi:hypothetical protein